MEFHEAADLLFDLRRFALRPGTAATRDLLAHLGDPQDALACVQVAGSNGKGSTACMLAAVLRESGLDVGLYTSPHLADVRERVRVNGRPLSEAALTEFVEIIAPYLNERGADGDSPTFFETTTAMALWAFERRDVDVAILEVGIGGQKDATSVVDPVASAVTTVDLEHTEILGDETDEVARDMAHVTPPAGPLVTAADADVHEALAGVAGDLQIVGGDGDVTVDYDGRDGLEGRATIEGPDWSVEARLPLLGAHQARNAGVAAALARRVADVDEATLAAGLRSAHWPGRFEVMGREPLVVLDGAHNPGSVASVADTLAEFDYDALHVVAGAMVDKDLRGIAAALPDPARVVACEPGVDRAETPAVVAEAFERETDAAVVQRPAVPAAVTDALDAATDGDCVLVTGSLYAVAEARARWDRTVVPTRVESEADARAVLDRAHVANGSGHPDEAVHRVHRTRLRPRRARALREAVLTAGGQCAISALAAHDREAVAVLVSGTLAQYRTAAARLAGDDGLADLAADLRAAAEADGRDRGHPWSDGPAVMGIVNVTPDSFHDGGEYDATEAAVARAEALVDAGAELVDVGGESTRPGAEPVPAEEERDRVLPVIEALADLDATVSVDTRKAAVARDALAAGADVINDVSGLADPEMRFVAAEHDAGLVVMHSHETPVDPDATPHHDDVVEEVIADLADRVRLAERAGVDRDRILVDPGLGFGKTPAEDFELLDRLDELRALDCPVMVGHSHKSMFAEAGAEPGDAPHATVAATALAVERGADVVRVHDAAENVRAVRVALAAREHGRGGH